ncbi:MAG: Ig-like domain-containing protein [Planctomycetota bacterium]
MMEFSHDIGSRAPLVPALAGIVLLIACGPPGGSGRSESRGEKSLAPIVLESLLFPDPSGQSSSHDRALPNGAPPNRALPGNASLVQPIHFVFSGPVAADDVGLDALRVSDDENAAVVGEYVTRGNVVSFYPALPTRPLRDLGGGVWDLGGAGLRPGTSYNVTVPVGTGGALHNLVGIRKGLWALHDYERFLHDGGRVGRNYPAGGRSGLFSVRMHTTADPALFLTGYEKRPPRLADVEPRDGAEGISPFLFTDPDRLFPEPQAFRLVFDHPLDPAPQNVGDTAFKLIDIEDADGRMIQVELGVDVRLVSNRHDEAVIELRPSGILPFGDLLGISYVLALRGLAGGYDNRPGEAFATVFRVAPAPAARARDLFQENFHTKDREERHLGELGPGVVPARWNEHESHVVQAAYSLTGNGELGRFVPFAREGGAHEIVLDTDSQYFPLFDGSTPDAPPGTRVTGGVFNFTEIVIPAGITVKAVGHHPLALRATGSVLIGGTIDVSGCRGADDQTFDSAITPAPGGMGGPGGGRGGVGNPLKWWGERVLQNQVPPRAGERGWGPGDGAPHGGGGGEGAVFPEPAWPCGKAHCNRLDGGGSGSRGSGGGGGTFYTRGAPGKDGRGSKVSLESLDTSGYPRFTDIPGGARPRGGLPGKDVFIDEQPLNDFIGSLGEIADVIGGEGGGGGGNRHDSLECTAYVFNAFPGFPGVLADSKGAGGGGGGGALVIEALGTIVLDPQATLLARGGGGGRGEQVGCSNWGGGGGGGAGGALVLRSALGITMRVDTTSSPQLDVGGGPGGYAIQGCGPLTWCGSGDPNYSGSGGDGGAGLIQVQVPAGTQPEIGGVRFSPEGSLVPPEWTPSELTPISVAQTVWINMGEVIRRGHRRPAWSFRGTDRATGLVETDEYGDIVTPARNDFRIDLPPVIDPETGLIIEKGRENHIPPGAWVRIEFQAADALVPGSKEVDSASIVPGPGIWSPDIHIADGHQFVRYRVVFNIADVEQGYNLGPERRRPVMRFIRLPFEF